MHHVRPARTAAILTIFLVGLGSVGGGLSSASDPSGAAPSSAEVAVAGGPPPPVLDEAESGQAALDAIGDRLPEVAAQSGMTTAELTEAFREDDTLHVDRTLRLFYVDPEPDASALGAGDEAQAELAALAAAAPITEAEAFSLHSRPESTHTIFLDLDGHLITGTAWNVDYGEPLVADPFSLDADPSFTPTERAYIQNIWSRVAEDYAPYDVDVTTEDPGFDAIHKATELDDTYGTRVVIDGGTPAFACSCGGVAYLYDYIFTAETHTFYQPAWVFQGAGGLNDPKNLAEAASHEAGHNLGLHHDGKSTTTYYRGHSAWAPIMGAGYDRPVTQFSKGEYSQATNTEDDLLIMPALGIPLLTDGNDTGSIVGATPLSGAAPVLTASGIVTTRTDVDVYSFSTPGGVVTIDADPAAVSPNLDISLALLDAAGTVIATNNPTVAMVNRDLATGLDATISRTLAAGSYFIRLDGVGVGTASTGYTDYASLGTYTIKTTLGVCALDEDLGDGGLDTARLLLPGESTSGVRCGSDDHLRIPGYSGGTLTASLNALDADLSLDLLSAAGTQLATVAVPAGTSVPLVWPFSANADHVLRVRGAEGAQSRYTLTTSMPDCPPVDQYEVGSYDDYPDFATPLSLPGTKDAISCSGDPNSGDFASVDLEAGRELTATVRFPQSAGSFQLLIMRYSQSSSSFSTGVTTIVTSNQIQLHYTPTATDTYQLWVRYLSGSTPYRLTVEQAPVEPTISGIAPSTGPVGTAVTITGTGFDEDTTVHFAGDPEGIEAERTIDSATSLTTTVPEGAIDGPITVANEAGSTTSAPFDVLVPPTISDIAPSTGPVGTAVTITGTGFDEDITVHFAGDPEGIEAERTIDSATSLTTTVPEGAIDGPITVANEAGPTTSAPFDVTVPDAPPTAEFVAPTTGATVRGVVALRVEATDDDAVARVDLYADGGLIGSVDVPDGDGLWSLSWTPGTLVDGESHLITAIALDTADQESAPAEVSIVIARPAVAGDYDGNGTTDQAYFRPSKARWYLSSQPGTSFRLGKPGDLLVPGDYDGDGDTDPAVYRPSNGRWYVFGQLGNTKFGLSTDIPVPGDYNGDGRTEPAVYRPSNGRWFLSTQPGSIPLGAPGDVLVPGDYDGDGTTEPAVYRPSDGRWYVYGQPDSVEYGTSTDIPVPGDYDGDGTTDRAYYRPSTGTWFLSTQPASIQLGEPGDVLVPGDYNGDGRTEPAVYRPSKGRWYISGLPGNIKFGTSTDIPVIPH